MIYDTKLTLKQNLSKVASGDLILDAQNRTIWITEDGAVEIPDGVSFRNFHIKLGAKAGINLMGKNSGIEGFIINNGTVNAPTPIIELVASDGGRIMNGRITGNTPRKAILCKTFAYNFLIDGLKIEDNIGFGILLNDAEVEQFIGYRSYEGGMYSGLYNDRPVAANWTIRNYDFGDRLTDPVRAGDAIEANAPMFGIDGMLLENIISRRTFTSGETANNGLAIGAAGVKNLLARNLEIRNAAKFGLHTEKGLNNTFENFIVSDSFRSLSVSHTDNVVFRNGKCINSGEMVTAYNRLDKTATGYDTLQKIVLDNIEFEGCTRHGILLSNAEGAELRNLKFSGYNAAPTGSVIRFYQQDVDKVRKGVNKSILENIEFAKGDSNIDPKYLVSMSDGTENQIGTLISNDYPLKVAVNENVLTL